MSRKLEILHANTPENQFASESLHDYLIDMLADYHRTSFIQIEQHKHEYTRGIFEKIERLALRLENMMENSANLFGENLTIGELQIYSFFANISKFETEHMEKLFEKTPNLQTKLRNIALSPKIATNRKKLEAIIREREKK